MQTFKPAKKKAKFTPLQKRQVRTGQASKAQIRSQIEIKQNAAYCSAKLRSQGLFDPKQRASKLRVLKIADMTPAQKIEYGVK